VGALVAGLCLLVAHRTAGRSAPARLAASLTPLLLLAVPVALAPANPVHGDVPAALATAYRFTVLFGQVGLWATVAGVHAWLGEPELSGVDTDYPATAD